MGLEAQHKCCRLNFKYIPLHFSTILPLIEVHPYINTLYCVKPMNDLDTWTVAGQNLVAGQNPTG